MQALSISHAAPSYDDLMPAPGRPTKRARTPFGERLAALREAAGLSQAQVADKLGITQPAYAYWEREPVALRAEQLAALADSLGVSADFLLGRQEPKARGNGPSGKLRQVFEKASRLPRHQQGKVIEFLENYLR